MTFSHSFILSCNSEKEAAQTLDDINLGRHVTTNGIIVEMEGKARRKVGRFACK
ncbi:MAG: hypothetical protein ACYSU5_24140 [Planctomycetota bacterium]|jgi:hypothetical protein